MSPYDDSKWNDGITEAQWLDAIERKRAYRCKVCSRRNIGTWIIDGIPCLDFDCRGRYGPVVLVAELTA